MRGWSRGKSEHSLAIQARRKRCAFVRFSEQEIQCILLDKNGLLQKDEVTLAVLQGEGQPVHWTEAQEACFGRKLIRINGTNVTKTFLEKVQVDGDQAMNTAAMNTANAGITANFGIRPCQHAFVSTGTVQCTSN